MKRVLVTGGAGYIGSVLSRQLLQRGYRVRVLDSLVFGGEPIVDLLSDPNFEFVKDDIKTVDATVMSEVDAVAHLAAIVGDPACAKEPELAKSTNLEGSKHLYHLAEANGVGRFVFASTCSNYGKMSDPNSFVTEESALAPVSLYAETKVGVEQVLLGQPPSNACKATCLRFSTVYGLSPRVRFDLTVNEFTKELALGRELVIFGEQFWRPYCHVVDLARSVVAILEAAEEKVAFNVFNVGDTEENYTKKMLVNGISEQIENCRIKYVQKDEDPRDYRVNFDKIRDAIGFKITKKVADGIREIHEAIANGFFVDADNSKYRNV